MTVSCDMTTAGGGWTIVYLAPGTNLTATPIPYTTMVPALLASAQDTLLVFRMATLDVYPSAATFALPADWRTTAPFDALPPVDLPVMVSVDDASEVSATLRYGRGDFMASCSDPWVTNLYGRVCIDGVDGLGMTLTAPFYSGFASTLGDWCSDSSEPRDTTACTPDRQFSIAVR